MRTRACRILACAASLGSATACGPGNFTEGWSLIGSDPAPSLRSRFVWTCLAKGEIRQTTGPCPEGSGRRDCEVFHVRMPRTRVQEVAGYGGVFLGTSAAASYLRADGIADNGSGKNVRVTLPRRYEGSEAFDVEDLEFDIAFEGLRSRPRNEDWVQRVEAHVDVSDDAFGSGSLTLVVAGADQFTFVP
jgi:hypothetical protein